MWNPFNRTSKFEAMQKQLTAQFAKIDLNFMDLHPVVHRAIVLEGLKFKSAEVAFDSFLDMSRRARMIYNDSEQMAEFLIVSHDAKLKIYEP